MPTSKVAERRCPESRGHFTQNLWQRVRHIYSFLGEAEVVFTPGMEWGPLVGSIGTLYENLKIFFEYLLFGES